MRLILNGIEIPKSDFEVDSTTVDIKDSDETGNRVSTVSQEFKLTGQAFSMVEEAFLLNPNGNLNSMTVLLYEEGCCDTDTLIFKGQLRGDNVDHCYGECSVRVNFVEFTEEDEKINCIKSTLISENYNNFQTQQHPRLKYCIELRPELLQHIILILGVIINLILTILTPIVWALSLLNNVLGFIEDAINSLGFNLSLSVDFDGNNATSLLEEYQNFRDQMNQRIIGCGRVHPSPFIRSYIQNVCDKCGLAFQSSIFNDPTSDYYRAVYAYAPVKKGTFSDNNLYIVENKPNTTLDLFLDELGVLFNSKWILRDNTIIFERKDFFNNGEPGISYMTLDGNDQISTKLCYSWRAADKPAYAEFKHTPDPMDSITNEAIPIYNDIVEWNIPYSQQQAGYKTYQFPFSPTRFRKDGVEEDVLGVYDNAGAIGDIIQEYNDVMILDRHLMTIPRILVLRPNTSWTDSKIVREDNFNGSFKYNRPMLFDELGIESNTIYPSNLTNTGMYQRFFTIDNPKVKTDLGKQFSFEFRYNCQQLQSIFTLTHVLLPLGTGTDGTVGEVTRIAVNLESKTILIEGTV